MKNGRNLLLDQMLPVSPPKLLLEGRQKEIISKVLLFAS